MNFEKSVSIITSAIKHLFVAVFVLSTLPVIAQRPFIQKLYAYKEMLPNTNIFISDTTQTATNGFYPNYLVYIELPEKDTSIWQTAIIANNRYLVHATVAETNPLVVGKRKTDERLIKIRTHPGNRLWKLEFDLLEKVQSTEVANPGAVVLKGTFKNKKVTSTVSVVVELENP